MTMRGAQKLFLAACAALLGLPAVLAEPWRDPISGQLSCLDSKGIPQCSTQYRVRSSCGGENAQACVRAWCNELKQRVTDESAHITLEYCAAENANSSDRRALGASDAFNDHQLAIVFRVKGDAVAVASKFNVDANREKVDNVLNSDLAPKDHNKDGKFSVADTDFTVADTTVKAEYCLGQGKQFKVKSGAPHTCKPPNPAHNTKRVSESGGTITVESGKGDNFVQHTFVKQVNPANSDKYRYWKVTAKASSTITVSAVGPAMGGWVAANDDLIIHLGNDYPKGTVKTAISSTSTTSLVVENGQEVYYEVGDNIEVQGETMHITEKSTNTLTVIRAVAGTSAQGSIATGKLVTNLSACRKFFCETVTCGADPQLDGGSVNMCVADDKFVKNGDTTNKKCDYFDCKNSNKNFQNDSGCCKRSKATCNSKFQYHASDDDDKKNGGDTRVKCGSTEHVAFGFCAGETCDGVTDKPACCVEHNPTGKEFGATSPLALKANFSTGSLACQDALKYDNFFQHLSDAVAKSLGKKPWEVVLVKAPDCPRVRALRSLEDATFELEALFSIKGALPKVDAKTGRHLDMETRAQAAYVAFLSSLLG